MIRSLPLPKPKISPRGPIKKKDYIKSSRQPLLKHRHPYSLNHYLKSIRKMLNKSGTPDNLPHLLLNSSEKDTTSTEEVELEECTYISIQ